MVKIQLFMEAVPVHLRTAFRILGGSSTSRLIVTLLPRTLKQIETIGKDCVSISNATHQIFVNVMNLLGEVISVTELSRGLQETRLKDADVALNVSRTMQNELNQFGNLSRTHFDQARESVHQAQNQFGTALSKIPSGFKGMIQDWVRVVVNFISKVTNKMVGAERNWS